MPKLKHFSLASFLYTIHYDDEVILLLRRMIDLEELILSLYISRISKAYIDGVELYVKILIYMPRLNKFAFNIHTTLLCNNVEIALLSNEDIQRSFIGWKYGQVASHMEFIMADISHIRHHIHSLPYEFDNYYVNNNFQGGMFNNVRRLQMTDSRPFECQFFKVISQHFPYLTGLRISNDQPQTNRQESTTPIVFPHLILLKIFASHEDYADQFLVHSKCHLPRLLNLEVGYKSLAIVTNNFTNNATRPTCAQLTSLTLNEPFVRTENFDEYFTLL